MGWGLWTILKRYTVENHRRFCGSVGLLWAMMSSRSTSSSLLYRSFSYLASHHLAKPPDSHHKIKKHIPNTISSTKKNCPQLPGSLLRPNWSTLHHHSINDLNLDQIDFIVVFSFGLCFSTTIAVSYPNKLRQCFAMTTTDQPWLQLWLQQGWSRSCGWF